MNIAWVCEVHVIDRDLNMNRFVRIENVRCQRNLFADCFSPDWIVSQAMASFLVWESWKTRNRADAIVKAISTGSLPWYFTDWGNSDYAPVVFHGKFSSVSRLDQPNYYVYLYLKKSICAMSMKHSRKFVIVVLINLPKYFASHFGHLTLKRHITFIFLAQKLGTLILQNFENVWHLSEADD